ncbi:MAG: DUF3106 domain-containing protein [Deltaproteobacteria bacterium]|nr:DUF3106 domain-containing protein [Deltaproteobacteria bacterium]
MSVRFRTRWVLAGALGACLALTPLFLRQAAAGGGNFPAASRGKGILPVRSGGVDRAGTVSRERDGDSGRRKGVRVAQSGEVTPEKLDRWRSMTPEEREKYRERYRRWEKLPPERRKKILERRQRWSKLPEEQRRFLKQRREIYRNAWPEEKQAIEKFFRRWRQLPPDRRQTMRRNLAEMRDLPASQRDERLMDWPFYRRFTPDERKAVNRFFFSEPSSGRLGGPRGSPRD